MHIFSLKIDLLRFVPGRRDYAFNRSTYIYNSEKRALEMRLRC